MSQFKRNKNTTQQSNESKTPNNNNNCLNEIIKSSDITSGNTIEQPILSSGKAICQKKYLELLIELIKTNNHQIIKQNTFVNANLFIPSLIESQSKTPNEFKRKKMENSINTQPSNFTEHLTTEELNKLIISLDQEFNENQRRLQLDYDMKCKEKANELKNIKEEELSNNKYVIDLTKHNIESMKKLIAQKEALNVSYEHSKMFLENYQHNYQSVLDLKKYIVNDYYKVYLNHNSILTTELAKTKSGYIKKGNNADEGKYFNQNKVSSKSNKNVSDKNMIMAQNQLKSGIGGNKTKKEIIPKGLLLNDNKKNKGK